MSLESLARTTRLIPSVTTWTRLEPQPRDATLSRSLQAQVRDPLWMLTRQWQVGEFLGSDGGSPVQASFAGNQQPLTTYRPGTAAAATVVYDATVPLEAHVERESPVLALRGSVQLGMYFESLVRNGGIASAPGVITAFRTAFPIATSASDPMLVTADALQFRALMAGRVTDGEALYASAAAVAAGQTPPTPLPGAAGDPGMSGVLSTFVAYRQSLFTVPNADSAWQDQPLRYAFAVGSPAPNDTVLLEAPEFPGGRLDWYSFSLETPTAPNASQPPATATVTPVAFSFFPNHVTFRGVHDLKWWMFEDSVTNFGDMDAQSVDLAKLLVMEFALIYGNDWFSVPVPTPIGSVTRVTTLVVTDTFGVRTLIRPTAPPWSMFTIAGSGGARSDFLIMAPTLGLVDDADPVETVMWVRDDMAAMAWAIEDELQGDMDSGLDAQTGALQRQAANTPPPPPAIAGGTQVYYTEEIAPPDNWVPLVPVTTAQGALLLRRGTMGTPAHAKILEPGQPFVVNDRTVPRAGLRTDRYFRRARTPSGGTVLWLARRSGPGTGEGWSGLRFDAVRDMAPAP
jgi:hypothetical protein